MNELLTLHQYDGNLAFDVPNTVSDRFIHGDEPQKWINVLKEFGLEVADNGAGSTQFFFDLGQHMPRDKHTPGLAEPGVLAMAGCLINLISWMTERGEADPRFFYGVVGRNSGETTLGISLRWPDQDDAILGRLAKDAMRQTAFRLGYPLKKGVRSALRAAVSSEYGIELLVKGKEDGLGGIWADLGDISPDLDNIALSGEVMGVEQQLICLAGALAIAHADELV